MSEKRLPAFVSTDTMSSITGCNAGIDDIVFRQHLLRSRRGLPPTWRRAEIEICRAFATQHPVPQVSSISQRIGMKLNGLPVEIRYASGLLDTAGQPAHAATYIRQRLIVLDDELKRNPREHRRILLHELFHFAWVRAGNSMRWKWEAHLLAEWNAAARGEMGWSAEWRKQRLTGRDVSRRTRRWREYCCESFCDSGAWWISGNQREVTLAPARRKARQDWFEIHFSGRVPI